MNSYLQNGSFPVRIIYERFQKIIDMHEFKPEEMVSMFKDFPVADEFTLNLIKDYDCGKTVLSVYKDIVKESTMYYCLIEAAKRL